ncbi:hypothetical protein GLAREA_01390 [Glarea lozoyensis ATCC 20868]|uniref:Uncharacterized protein n=1 Tax=Glarea lozoyensis (strain ATCC 20868 / MF5171) TaxID=1116229 RepID=S3DFQ5_GLAL2|nr:uncharacterized protein GLAREA_01390 [Glarea lozoyensis ATCC 20868]EPE25478.1 hypothetical protein GLAREA_01390 [Glarea lozoyensis ATCC 20868]
MPGLMEDDFDSQLPNMNDYHRLDHSSSIPGSDDTISNEIERATVPTSIVADADQQDSLRSCVEETQFVNLEVDTQAPEKTSFVIVPPTDQANLPSQVSADAQTFISVPETFAEDDMVSGFTFGKAPKAKIGQFSDRPQRSTTVSTKVEDSSTRRNSNVEKPSLALRNTANEPNDAGELHQNQQLSDAPKIEIRPNLVNERTSPMPQASITDAPDSIRSDASLPTRGRPTIAQPQQQQQKQRIPEPSTTSHQQIPINSIIDTPSTVIGTHAQLTEQLRLSEIARNSIASHASRLRSGPRLNRRGFPEKVSTTSMRTPKSAHRPFPDVQSEPRRLGGSPVPPPIDLRGSNARRSDGSISVQHRAKSIEPHMASEYASNIDVDPHFRDNLPAKGVVPRTPHEVTAHPDAHHHAIIDDGQDRTPQLRDNPQACSRSPSAAITDTSQLPPTPRPQSRSNTSAFRARVDNAAEQRTTETPFALNGHHESPSDEGTIRHSFGHKAISRPLRQEQAATSARPNEAEGRSKTEMTVLPQVLRSNLANKIDKHTHTKSRPTINTSPQRTYSPKRPVSPNYKACQKYMKACHALFETRDHEIEKMKIQEAEIWRLKNLNEENTENIRKLEKEKTGLVQKVEKYIKHSETYKQHINKVVDSQNSLRVEAGKIRETSTKVIEAYHDSTLDAEDMKNSVKKMQKTLAEIKAVRSEIDKAQSDERSSLALAREATKVAEEKVREVEERLEELDRKNNESIELLAKSSDENQELNQQIKFLRLEQKALEKQIEDHLSELQGARTESERLDRQLSDHLKVHEKLVGAIGEIPVDVCKELQKEDGIFSSILSADQTMSARLEDLAALAEEIKNDEAKVSPALIKMIEELSNRVPQISDDRTKFEDERQQFSALFESLRESLNQFGVDSQTRIDLDKRIAELQQENLAITASKNAAELESRSISSQLQLERLNASSYKNHLETKTQELKDLQAVPKEDPRLLAKITALEGTSKLLNGKLESVTQELITLQEKNANLQEMVKTSQDKAVRLEREKQELRIAFTTEKQQEAEIAEKNKAEKEKWNQTTMDNLRRQIQDKNAELTAATESLHKIKAELDLARQNPQPEVMDQILKLSTLATELHAKSSSHSTAELSNIQALGVEIQRGTTETEQTQRRIASIKETQASLTHSLQKYEMRDATLSKEVLILEREIHQLKAGRTTEKHQGTSQPTTESAKAMIIASRPSCMGTHPRIVSSRKAVSDRPKDLPKSFADIEARDVSRNMMLPTPSAMGTNLQLAKDRGSSRINLKVIPDSQSQAETEWSASQDEHQVNGPQTTPIRSTGLGYATSGPLASQETPGPRSFASLGSYTGSSSASDMTRLSDLGFDEMALDSMDSKHVITTAQALSRNKHSNNAGHSMQLHVKEQNTSSKRNTSAVSNESSNAECLGNTTPASPATPASPEQVQMKRGPARKQPQHRQSSKPLKSALKNRTVVFQSSASISTETSQATSMNTADGKVFKLTEIKSQNIINRPPVRKNPSVYNRVASGSSAGAKSNSTITNEGRTKNATIQQSQISLIPNAARRNSSFAGFNESRKRPAEMQATSSINKAPRLSQPPQIETEMKNRLSIPTAGSGFGKRR